MWKSAVRRGLTAVLLVVSSMTGILSQSAGASDGGVTVYLQPLDLQSGSPIYDACFVFVGASEEGCDENGDGYISYQDMAPGNYVIRQTRDAAGYYSINDSIGEYGIYVRPSPQEQTYPVYLAPRSGNSGGNSGGSSRLVDIAIVPTDARTGASLPGACFVIGDYSEEGCDENYDGQVTFDDIPVGTWEVIETRAPDGYAKASSQTITINGPGRYEFIHNRSSNSSSGSSRSSVGKVHVALVTRDPDNGELVTGVCYIIEGASIEGCDENGDGQVDYEDVTPGTYTVRQTLTPAGYPQVRPFEIVITRDDPAQAFIVKQAPDQNDASHRNLSIVLVDKATGARITGADACLRVGESEIGCDENEDGQIDFLDIPVGTHTVRITDMPPGYHGEYTSYTLKVNASPYSIVTVYLPLIRN